MQHLCPFENVVFSQFLVITKRLIFSQVAIKLYLAYGLINSSDLVGVPFKWFDKFQWFGWCAFQILFDKFQWFGWCAFQILFALYHLIFFDRLTPNLYILTISQSSCNQEFLKIMPLEDIKKCENVLVGELVK